MIKFDSVTKTYATSTRPALDHVSFTIDDGEFVFLIGPSGSGKSTLFNLIIREETLDSGDIWVGDYHVNTLKTKDVATMRQHVGYVFQDFRLLKKKNVYDNVAFALEVIGKKRSEIAKAVPRALEMVGLEAKSNRMPSELSGGEQQRVAIARAFVNNPVALIADEPTGNLDPSTADDIIALLARINREGTTVLMSTHNARAVNMMRERVIELDRGKLVRDDARGVYGAANL